MCLFGCVCVVCVGGTISPLLPPWSYGPTIDQNQTNGALNFFFTIFQGPSIPTIESRLSTDGAKVWFSVFRSVYYIVIVNLQNVKITNSPLCRLVYQACDLASIQAVKQRNYHPSIEFNVTYLHTKFIMIISLYTLSFFVCI